jgi:hypothetical protein
MIINRKGIVCKILRIEYPYYIWYPFRMLLHRLEKDYIIEKLGATHPEKIRRLQDEFADAHQEATEGPPDFLETHTLRFDKHDWYFHLADKSERSVTIFLERGLSFSAAAPTVPHPLGYAWTILEPRDTPETINRGLYCNDIKFAKALHRKLWKVMGW